MNNDCKFIDHKIINILKTIYIWTSLPQNLA